MDSRLCSSWKDFRGLFFSGLLKVKSIRPTRGTRSFNASALQSSQPVGRRFPIFSIGPFFFLRDNLLSYQARVFYYTRNQHPLSHGLGLRAGRSYARHCRTYYPGCFFLAPVSLRIMAQIWPIAQACVVSTVVSSPINWKILGRERLREEAIKCLNSFSVIESSHDRKWRRSYLSRLTIL